MSDPAGKYARFELERRFLVKYLPDAIAQGQGWQITDRYIKNTRLRLRRMEPLAGGETKVTWASGVCPALRRVLRSGLRSCAPTR